MSTRLLPASLILLSILSSAALAQQPRRTTAYINIDLFSHPTRGIRRLVHAQDSIDLEFDKQRRLFSEAENALLWLQDGPEREQIKRAVEKKGLEVQSAYQNRLNEVIGPIYADINRQLQVFADAHGLTMYEGGSLHCLAGCKGQSGAIPPDITQEFISEYNRLHPEK